VAGSEEEMKQIIIELREGEVDVLREQFENLDDVYERLDHESNTWRVMELDEERALIEQDILEIIGWKVRASLDDHREFVPADKVSKLIECTEAVSEALGKLEEESLGQNREIAMARFHLDTAIEGVENALIR
jgi:hypothetical protein